MQKIKDHLDKIIAVLLIAACVALVAWRLTPAGEQTINVTSVETSLVAVEKALRDNTIKTGKLPDYAGTFSANIGRSEGELSQSLIGWRFFPRPPYVMGFAIDPPPTFTAELSPPSAAAGDVWVGHGSVNFVFGGDKFAQGKWLLIWSKPASEAKWPTEPMAAIAGSATAGSMPAGITASAAGYQLRVDALPPRTPYEYRACTLAIFPAKWKGGESGKEREGLVKLPADKANFLAVPDELKPYVQKLLAGAPPEENLLKGGPFVTQFSAVAKVELPSDVQIRLNGLEQDEDGKYVRGSFAMRRWIPAREKWVEKVERINKGSDIKGEKQERPERELITYVIDAAATLVDLDIKFIDKEVEVEEYQKDPKTGKMVLVKVKRKVAPERVQSATIRDKHSGQVHVIYGRADEWWPKGLQISPKAADPKAPAPLPAVGPVGPAPVVPKVPAAVPPAGPPPGAMPVPAPPAVAPIVVPNPGGAPAPGEFRPPAPEKPPVPGGAVPGVGGGPGGPPGGMQ